MEILCSHIHEVHQVKYSKIHYWSVKTVTRIYKSELKVTVISAIQQNIQVLGLCSHHQCHCINITRIYCQY
jgi:hypothetical protein